MGDVGSVRYEPALLPPFPTIRVLCHSNCQRSITLTPAVQGLRYYDRSDIIMDSVNVLYGQDNRILYTIDLIFKSYFYFHNTGL